MRDAWLAKATPRGPWTWAERRRQFRAFVPAAECQALCEILREWGASPDDVAPLLRVLRDLVVANAVHRAARKGATGAAGAARDPHHQRMPERRHTNAAK